MFTNNKSAREFYYDDDDDYGCKEQIKLDEGLLKSHKLETSTDKFKDSWQQKHVINT